MVYAPNGDLFVSSFAGNTITVLRDGKNVGTFAARGAIAAPGGRCGPLLAAELLVGLFLRLQVEPRVPVPAAGGGAPRGPAPQARGWGGPRWGSRTGCSDTAACCGTPASAVPCTNTTIPAGTVGINQPQGMAFQNGYLYIANTDSIVRYKYSAGDTTAQGTPEKVTDLVGRGNHAWRNIIFNAAGTKILRLGGFGFQQRCWRRLPARRDPRVQSGWNSWPYICFSGIRNPEGLAWQPGVNNVLWTSVNERDGYGDNLPPDYITSVKDGGFYGWPYSYTGQNYDPRYVGGMPDLVKKALVPDVLIEAHSAAVGLTFYTGTQFPQRFRNGAFVGLHGSWNSSVAHGYKVIFVPFTNGKPGPTEDFLTGFVVDPAAVSKWGRPVGVTVAKDGSLLVADDGSNKIWQIRYTGPAGR